MKRREFLRNSLLGMTSAPLVKPLASEPDTTADPFTLGIASGDMTGNSVVLWTRLAPEPLQADGGMAFYDVPVRWELATDENFSSVIRRGEVIASPELAHSVHVELENLEPDTEYWYRFFTAHYNSQTGRTKTLPDSRGKPESIRFATASCQNYSHGYFVAYRHMVEDKPDFVIHLGDYIYDTSFGTNFRHHETESAPQNLSEFRRRHALYKTDKDLQYAHAQLPFFTTIDNHDAIEDNDPAKSAQRAAAYQAWYEHMPVRGYDKTGQNHFDLSRRIALGELAQISLLDARQFRDKKDLCRANMDPDYGFGNYRERCEEVLKETRSMLGEQQERWLVNNIAGNRADWNVIASPGPFQPFSYKHEGKDLRYIGAWDAYPENRKRIAKAIASAGKGHPLIVSGDVHSFWAIDGALTRENNERIPLVEFVTSSISANWPEPLAKPVTDNLPHNPQVQYYNPDKRGYMLHEVSRSEWHCIARGTENVRDEKSKSLKLAGFLVRHGEQGFTQT